MLYIQSILFSYSWGKVSGQGRLTLLKSVRRAGGYAKGLAVASGSAELSYITSTSLGTAPPLPARRRHGAARERIRHAVPHVREIFNAEQMASESKTPGGQFRLSLTIVREVLMSIEAQLFGIESVSWGEASLCCYPPGYRCPRGAPSGSCIVWLGSVRRGAEQRGDARPIHVTQSTPLHSRAGRLALHLGKCKSSSKSSSHAPRKD